MLEKNGMKKGKIKFVLAVFLCSLFITTSAYAITSTEVGKGIFSILDEFLNGVREAAMGEVEPQSVQLVNDIKGDVQVTVDQAKIDSKAELEAYIAEKSDAHLLELERLRDLLKLDVLDQANASLLKQKAAVDAEFKAKEDALLLELNAELE